MFNIEHPNFVIYNGYIEEKYRTILTRWRLSNFDLQIETGRYSNIAREQRICNFCNDNVVEDENHVIFECSLYHEIRQKQSSIIRKYNTVGSILNPVNIEDCCSVARLLTEIEQKRGLWSRDDIYIYYFYMVIYWKGNEA